MKTQAPVAPLAEISVNSGRLAARSAVSHLMKSLGPLHLREDDAGTVELVVVEAINNVVEHAYPTELDDGPIKLTCARTDAGLKVSIVDRGKALPHDLAAMGKVQNMDVDPMEIPEGGFGWFLIKDLTDSVTYHRLGWENHLHLNFVFAAE